MSSLSAPEDFDGRSVVFDIPINIADVCLNIPIEEDNIFEDTEFFEVGLTSTSLLICATHRTALVGIVDTTRKYMGRE